MLVWFLSFTPRPLAVRLGRVLGALAYRFARTDRRRAVRQLGEAFGDQYSLPERRALTKRMFRHFGEVALDIVLFSRWGIFTSPIVVC